MEIMPCSPTSLNLDIAPKTVYEKAYTAALNKEPRPKKKSLSSNSRLARKTSTDIILNGKSHADLELTIESAVENDALV